MMTFHVIQREPTSETFVMNILSTSIKYGFIDQCCSQRNGYHFRNGDQANITYLISDVFNFPRPFYSIRSKIDPKDMDKTIHAINTISGLLQGPFDVGNALVGHQGIMEMMVALCGSEREVDQMVAVEALIHSSSKMSRASFIITNGVSLLKDIYKKTKNERIKIRALVVSMHSMEDD